MRTLDIRNAFDPESQIIIAIFGDDGTGFNMATRQVRVDVDELEEIAIRMLYEVKRLRGEVDA